MRTARTTRGGAIAETGPALFLLLILILFPVMDLLYMGCGFGFAWFLHNAEIRELAVRPPKVAEAQTYLARVDNEFCNSSAGIAKFLGITPATMSHRIQHPDPVYTPATAGDPNGRVKLTTTVNVPPWLNIPLFVSVPGINTELPFRFESEKPQEENGKN